MKRVFLILGAITFFLSSCIKNDPVLFTGQAAEIDQAVWNANAAGLTYPILTRTPAENRPVTTADSTLRRTAGTIRVRVNQVGPQSSKEETVGYKLFASPVTSVSFPATASGQTPAAAAGTLSVINAVAGTHFTQVSGKVTIPANSSFGYITIPVLNAGPTSGQAVFIGIELDETGTIKPSVNYSKLGLILDQR